MDKIWIKKRDLLILGVSFSILMFGAGVLSRNIKHKINSLENDLAEIRLLQEDLSDFYYSSSLDSIELKDVYWGCNRSRKDHLFIVVSEMNCSMCLSDFLNQIISFQDSLDVNRSSILLLNSSEENLHRYKRVYNIKIPMYCIRSGRLNVLMKRFDMPFIFVSDKRAYMKYLYSFKENSFLKSYLRIMYDRIFKK